MSEEMSLEDVFESEADNVIIQDDVIETVEEVKTVEEVTAPTAELIDENTNSNEELGELSFEDNGFKQTAISERKKRQADRAELVAIKAKMQQMQSQANQQPVTPVEAPDAYMAPQEAIDHANGRMSNDFTTKLLNMSESQARGRHEDFDLVKDVFFNEMAISNPALIQQAMNAPDPYEFVYQQSKNHSELSGIGNINDYRAKVEAEIREKIKSESDTLKSDLANKAINDALPESLAGTTAIGGNQEPAYSEIELEDALLNNF